MKLSRVSAVLTAVALTPAILFPATASATDTPAPAGVSAPDNKADEENKAKIQAMLADPKEGPGVREAAQLALDGTPEDRVRFLEIGQHNTRESDLRVRLSQIMSVGGPAVRAAANRAMDGGVADVIAFLEHGRFVAEGKDRLTVSQLAETGGAAVKAAALTALDGTSYSVIAKFLNEGLAKAEAADKAAAEQTAKDKAAAVTPVSVTTTPPATPTPTTPPTTAAVTAAVTTTRTELADTGASDDLAWQIGGGAAAVAAGAALLVAMRRRSGAEG